MVWHYTSTIAARSITGHPPVGAHWYLDAPDAYPDDVSVYRDLFKTQQLAAEFTGTPAPWHDPVIRIYRLLPVSD